jgi:hypothetical protein
MLCVLPANVRFGVLQAPLSLPVLGAKRAFKLSIGRACLNLLHSPGSKLSKVQFHSPLSQRVHLFLQQLVGCLHQTLLFLQPKSSLVRLVRTWCPQPGPLSLPIRGHPDPICLCD